MRPYGVGYSGFPNCWEPPYTLKNPTGPGRPIFISLESFYSKLQTRYLLDLAVKGGELKFTVAVGNRLATVPRDGIHDV